MYLKLKHNYIIIYLKFDEMQYALYFFKEKVMNKIN